MLKCDFNKVALQPIAASNQFNDFYIMGTFFVKWLT